MIGRIVDAVIVAGIVLGVWCTIVGMFEGL